MAIIARRYCSPWDKNRGRRYRSCRIDSTGLRGCRIFGDCCILNFGAGHQYITTLEHDSSFRFHLHGTQMRRVVFPTSSLLSCARALEISSSSSQSRPFDLGEVDVTALCIRAILAHGKHSRDVRSSFQVQVHSPIGRRATDFIDT